MTLLPSSEAIVLHVVFSFVENKILSKSINIQVAVLGAHGAIATHGFLLFEVWDLGLVLHGATVAAGFIPDFFGGFWCCHDMLRSSCIIGVVSNMKPIGMEYFDF